MSLGSIHLDLQITLKCLSTNHILFPCYNLCLPEWNFNIIWQNTGLVWFNVATVIFSIYRESLFASPYVAEQAYREYFNLPGICHSHFFHHVLKNKKYYQYVWWVHKRMIIQIVYIRAIIPFCQKIIFLTISLAGDTYASGSTPSTPF